MCRGGQLFMEGSFVCRLKGKKPTTSGGRDWFSKSTELWLFFKLIESVMMNPRVVSSLNLCPFWSNLIWSDLIRSSSFLLICTPSDDLACSPFSQFIFITSINRVHLDLSLAAVAIAVFHFFYILLGFAIYVSQIHSSWKSPLKNIFRSIQYILHTFICLFFPAQEINCLTVWLVSGGYTFDYRFLEV